MRIMIAGMKQESNSFCPATTKLEDFTNNQYESGQELLDNYKGLNNTDIDGFAEVILAHGDEIVPGLCMRAPSGGPVEKSVADHWLERFYQDYDREKPDALFLVMHGGMCCNDGADDGTGYIYRNVRAHVGKDLVIAAVHDMHTCLTRDEIEANVLISGYQTYPHQDMKNAARRAAMLGYRAIEKKPLCMSAVFIPMIVPAEGYSTQLDGPFKDLAGRCRSLVEDGTILDYTIFQMQPWINHEEAASSVIVAAEDQETADSYAKKIAHELFDIRKEMSVSLYTIDEVIDAAIANRTGKPVILVDAADSPNAGSLADSSAVIERLVERDVDINCAVYINDAPASDKAFELGVGAEAEFTLGGTLDKVFQKPYTLKARVHSLHEGIYRNEGPAYPGKIAHVGKTAVLKHKNIDIVAMRYMTWSYDLQAYAAFGLDPRMYDLVVVKSANQYKVNYLPLTDLFYPTDTPGASSANLAAMPFDRVKRPFYPLDDFEAFDDTPVAW